LDLIGAFFSLHLAAVEGLKEVDEAVLPDLLEN